LFDLFQDALKGLGDESSEPVVAIANVGFDQMLLGLPHRCADLAQEAWRARSNTN
jgi:hypothetical protein